MEISKIHNRIVEEIKSKKNMDVGQIQVVVLNDAVLRVEYLGFEKYKIEVIVEHPIIISDLKYNVN